MAARKKNSAAKTTHAQATQGTVPPRFDGQTPKEAADNLRMEARRIEGYRNRPEVLRAIARNPQVLRDLIEMERIAAEYRKMADFLETEFGDMTAAEFAALNAYTNEWARNNPEKAAELVRNA